MKVDNNGYQQMMMKYIQECWFNNDDAFGCLIRLAFMYGQVSQVIVNENRGSNSCACYVRMCR